MKSFFISCLLLCLFAADSVMAAPPAFAYRVKFKDKNGTLTFADSLLFLTQKSLDRRSKQGLTLDSSDLPVVPAYINQVMTTAAAVKLHNVSKWFNQIVVITLDSSKVIDIAALPIVQSVTLVARYPNGVYKTNQTSSTPDKFPVVNELQGKRIRPGSSYYGVAFQQINLMHGDYLHDIGFKGEGMDIAIFDVNFRYANTCPAYDSLNLQNRIKDVNNFARDTAYVFSTAIPNDHGMNVLGCMAANIPGTYVGTAPNANFHLYITEDWLTEQPIEEDNWLSAAERADSIGVYIVNSSLGYNTYTDLPSASYTYANMDGSSMIAKAANKAVSKGMFIVNAQGNEGASAWHYMLTPADADSVYSVGTVDGSGIWGSSGYGPTYDGRIKPDGCAMGKAAMLIGGSCNPGSSNGSSFASPMLCGSIACLWQSAPTLTAFELRRIVRMCSDRYTAPNNTLGYGIPNFELAHNIITGNADVKNIDYTFSLYPNPCNGLFSLRSYDPAIQQVSYALYDMKGQLIYQSEKLIDANFTSDVLENKPSGEYVLLISSMTKTFSTRIIKQ